MIEAVIVNISESRLIDEAQAGNSKAFDRLMELHMDRVYSVALKIVKDPSEAEDVTQEVFINVYRKLDSFRGDATFSTWIYRITVNRAFRHLKKLSRSQPVSDVTVIESQADGRPTPEGIAIETEKSEKLRMAMNRLPEKQRAVLALRIEHSLSFKEIAKIMDRSIGGVKSNYFHAVQKVRSIFSGGTLQ